MSTLISFRVGEYSSEDLDNCQVVAFIREFPMYEIGKRSNRYRVGDLIDWGERSRISDSN